MAPMASAPKYGLNTVAGWFRMVALAEAVSWVGLLIGMYFKHLGSARTEIGVQVFGPVHGAMFVAYLVVGALTAVAFKWNPVTCLQALLGSLVPLGSVIFLIWAERSGKMGASSAVGPARPGQPVPETA